MHVRGSSAIAIRLIHGHVVYSANEESTGRWLSTKPTSLLNRYLFASLVAQGRLAEHE